MPPSLLNTFFTGPSITSCHSNPPRCLTLQDFGKYPYVRRFVQDYMQALNSQNDGRRVVHEFVDGMHGPTSTCPHLRVLPNLVATCTSAVCVLVAEQKDQERLNSITRNSEDITHHLHCYLSVLNKM